jgi:peroxiredoxin
MTRTTRRKRRAHEHTYNPRLIVAGSVLIVAVAFAVIVLTADDSSTRTANAGQTAADFTLPGLSGEVSLADFRGKYVLVNFWASWCPPCKAEMPDLYAYHRQYQAQGFTLLGVNVGEDANTVQAFLAAYGFDFPVALDLTGAVYNRYGGDGLPSSFLIGPDGTLVKAWRPGAITRAMLDRDVTPMLFQG